MNTSTDGTVGAIETRAARVEDAAEIEAVHYSAREAVYEGRVADWPPAGPDRPGRVARWEQWLSDPDIDCIVAVDRDEILGFATIRASTDADADATKVAEMPTLYVHPDRWRSGCGRTLCAASLDRARERGFEELTLWVVEMNTQARDFYEAFGFVAEDVTEVDEGTTEKLVARRYRMALEAGA